MRWRAVGGAARASGTRAARTPGGRVGGGIRWCPLPAGWSRTGGSMCYCPLGCDASRLIQNFLCGFQIRRLGGKHAECCGMELSQPVLGLAGRHRLLNDSRRQRRKNNTSKDDSCNSFVPKEFGPVCRTRRNLSEKREALSCACPLTVAIAQPQANLSLGFSDHINFGKLGYINT